jgi:hypothetical protein
MANLEIKVGQGSTEKVLRRAHAIKTVSNMRLDSNEGLTAVETKLRLDLQSVEQAHDAEETLKKELIELYTDRKRYIRTMDEIYQGYARHHNQNPGFWKEVLAILQENGDDFVCHPQHHSP